MYILKLNGDLVGNYSREELSVELTNISGNPIAVGNDILEVDLNQLLNKDGYTVELES